MFTLFGFITLTEVETFLNDVKASATKEHFEERGIVDQSIYRMVGENRVAIVNTYNTLEDAQRHKAILETPELETLMKPFGVEFPMSLWIAEYA